MPKCHILNRAIASLDGRGRMVVPIKAFDSMGAAQQAARLRTEALQAMVGCQLLDRSGAVVGVSVAQLMQELGIHGFEHFIDTVELHGGELLQPAPSIIIPR